MATKIDGLRLCLERKQESNQSHFASSNCDHCKALAQVKKPKPPAASYFDTRISELKVMGNPAGYYVGRSCEEWQAECQEWLYEPYGIRHSGFFGTRLEAKEYLHSILRTEGVPI